MLNHAATRWQQNKDIYMPRMSRIVCNLHDMLLTYTLKIFVCSLSLPSSADVWLIKSLTKSLVLLLTCLINLITVPPKQLK
jgi:hypothetical protein